jgi:hypothetical protein
VLLWRSRADAEEVARLIGGVPACAEWFRHIEGASSIQHVEVRDAWAAAVGQSTSE